MYYLRSRPAADPIKFTVDVETLLKNAGEIINKEEGSVMTQSKRGNQSHSSQDGEEKDKVKKMIKPNDENGNSEVKVCPMRRPGAADDEQCFACGS